MRRWALASALAAALSAWPALVDAQTAFTTRAVHLRAGPGRSYPVVSILRGGLTVRIEGCLADYRWCDVDDGINRGWVYAANLGMPHQGASVTVLDNGALLGIVVLSFVLGDYWGDHYRSRPWYPQQRLWIHRPAVPVPPPPAIRPPPARPPQTGPGPHAGPRPAPGQGPQSGRRLQPDARPAPSPAARPHPRPPPSAGARSTP